jgi:hypothetical protein
VKRALTLLLALLMSCALAHAGDRKAGIVYSNFTPDAQSAPASRQCSAAIEKQLAAEYATVYKLGEAAIRKLAGAPSGSRFFEWPKDRWAPIQKPGKHSKDDTVDAIVLVDCRPEAKQLDVALVPPTGAIVRITWRDTPLDARAITVVADAIVQRMFAGFSP